MSQKSMGSTDRGRRDELAAAIAAIVLADGLDALSLRPLAARLGTSARMLLYHFGSKDALIRAVLGRIADAVGQLQHAASSGPAESPAKFLADLLRSAADPATAPLARAWTEVIARAAREEQPYRAIAAETVGGWLDWIANRLIPGPDNGAVAVAILSIVEGIAIVEAARPGTTPAAQRLLPTLFDARQSTKPSSKRRS